MNVRIYQPPKNAMQSGYAVSKQWVLEYLPMKAQKADDLMGWIGGKDTLEQVRLKFETKEDAIAFAKRKGLSFEITEAKKRTIKPKSYADNFK